MQALSRSTEATKKDREKPVFAIESPWEQFWGPFSFLR
jgi:hypothetical protein